jgi:hypothetical protein
VEVESLKPKLAKRNLVESPKGGDLNKIESSSNQPPKLIKRNLDESPKERVEKETTGLDIDIKKRNLVESPLAHKKEPRSPGPKIQPDSIQLTVTPVAQLNLETKPEPKTMPLEIQPQPIKNQEEADEPKALKKEYQKVMQQKQEEKHKARLQEKELEKKYYDMLSQGDEKRTKEQQKRKEGIKKDFVDSKEKIQKTKEATRTESKQTEKSVQDYFNKIHEEYLSQMQNQVKDEKDRIMEYKDQLKRQIAANEEAKKKLRKGDLEAGKKIVPIALESSSKNPYIDKNKYKQEIEKEIKAKSPKKPADVSPKIEQQSPHEKPESPKQI